ADFDVSRKMGDILLSHRKLDSLNDIIGIYKALFPNNKKLKEALKQEGLRHLYLVRNLIVHRAARVDSMFVHEMGLKATNLEGNNWRVEAKAFEAYLKTVLETGLEILTAIQEAVNPGSVTASGPQ